MSRDERPKTAALTSRSAVIATLLLAGAIGVMAIAVRGCEIADEGSPAASGTTSAGLRAPDVVSRVRATVALTDDARRPAPSRAAVAAPG